MRKFSKIKLDIGLARLAGAFTSDTRGPGFESSHRELSMNNY